MRPITIKITRSRFETPAWPTPVAGLAIQSALDVPGPIDLQCVRPSWLVTHVRSGLYMCCCLRSPEGALAFVNALDAWDWTLNADEICPDPERWTAVARARAQFEGSGGHRRFRDDYGEYTDVNAVGDV